MTIQGVARLLVLAKKQHQNLDGTKENVIFWQALLADLPDEVGLAALMVHLKTSPFPPKVADICRIAESMKENKPPMGEEAWLEVRKKLNPYQKPEWSHPLIGEAVRYLGYSRLCMSTRPGDDMEQFVEVYERLVERKKQEGLVEGIKEGIGLLDGGVGTGVRKLGA